MCVVALSAGLACVVIQSAQVMKILITTSLSTGKSLSVRMSLWGILLIRRSSEGMPVNLRLEGMARLATLITQESARLRMRLHGGGGAHSPRIWTG